MPIQYIPATLKIVTYTTFNIDTVKITVMLICDWILENCSKSHIWYFEKYQFQYSRHLGVLLGINKVALRYQWAPYVHLGPCHVVGPLWLFLSTPDQMARLPWSQVCWTHPPSRHHPPLPLPPTHPLYTTHVILQKLFKKPLQNQ